MRRFGARTTTVAGASTTSASSPTEEASFRRTVEIDAAAIAELGLDPMPEPFFRRLAELFMVTSHWHIFPDAYPRWARSRTGD